MPDQFRASRSAAGTPSFARMIAPCALLSVIGLAACDATPTAPAYELAPAAGSQVAGLNADAVEATSASLQAQQQRYTIPASIDATGKQDVTEALLRFIATVPDGSTIVFPEGAQYRSEGVLFIHQRKDLTFEGNGATVLARGGGHAAKTPAEMLGSSKHAWVGAKWPRKRSHFMFNGGSGIIVRDLIVKGPHPIGGTHEAAYMAALEAQHGFEFIGTRKVRLERVRVTDVFGDFVYLGMDGKDVWAEDIQIRDSHFERNGRMGIAITGAKNVLIERNYIGQVRHSSFDIEPNNTRGGAIDVTLRNNVWGRSRLLWVVMSGAAGRVEDITVQGNVLRGNPMTVHVSGKATGRRKNIRVLNNVTDSQYSSNNQLFRFHYVDGIEVRGNESPLDPKRNMTAVRVENSCGLVYGKDNKFVGAVVELNHMTFAGCR